MSIELGIMLRAYRKQKGWTQVEMSEHLEMVVTTYRKYEAGQIDIKHSVMKVIREKTGISIDASFRSVVDEFVAAQPVQLSERAYNLAVDIQLLGPGYIDFFNTLIRAAKRLKDANKTE